MIRTAAASPAFRRTIARVVAAAIMGTAVAAVAPASGSTVGIAAGPDDVVRPVSQLAEAADLAVAAGVPGVLVRVDDGRGRVVNIVRQADWSVADHRLRARDRFKMGSNTKTLTATLVLQLVAQDRISLDDPIQTWLPGAVPNGDDITVRMLLNHTSGLADYAYNPQVLALMTGIRTDPLTETELLALGTKMAPMFAPGRGWSYSNTGYIALGLLLEKVTGLSVAQLVEQRIAQPLGLRDTHLPTADNTWGPSGRLAHGYEPDAAHLAPLLPPGTPEGFGFVGPTRGVRIDVTGIDQAWDGAAGAVISTTRDWARFDRALMNGTLVPRSLLKQMRTVVPTDASNGLNRNYGLGLEKVHTPCGTVWGHDGALPGYRSDNYTDRTGRRTVSVLATTHFTMILDDEASAAEDDLVIAAVCAMFGKPIPSGL